ncbi:MAG: molybdopterin molybdotransferase MoeA [Akkermansiaceae bacterium]
MISVAEAETIISQHLDTSAVESVPLHTALGRYLRQDVLADRLLPPFDRVMMDGIAIAHASYAAGGTSYPISGTQAAGSSQLSLSDANSCIEVMTGCALPEGCDCVIPVEQIEVSGNTATLRNGDEHRLGQHIHPAGSDGPAGEILLHNGQRLGPTELTIAASVGATNLQVSRLPRILTITTGDELVDPETTPESHQIRRSHDITLQSVIGGMGLGTVESIHVRDDPEALNKAITGALSTHEVLILTGGISRGKFDHVAPVLEEILGPPHFHGIAQRPGKPMAFWTHSADHVSLIRADDGAAKGGGEKARRLVGLLDRSEATRPEGVSRLAEPANQLKRLIFALPGNPVSVMACTARYLIPALRQMLGGSSWQAPTLPATGSFKCPAHFTGLVPYRIRDGRIQLAQPSNSGNFLALANTDGVAELTGDLAGKELLNHPASFYPWSHHE